MSSISPMGNQDKFYDIGTDRWYKADHLGYEGLSEYVVSELLKHSRIRNQHFAFVRYSMCHFKIGNKQMTGCYSRNFMGDSESELSLFRFFKTYFNIDITVRTLGLSAAEQIKYVVDSVEMITGLSDFGAFLTLNLELDAFVLNDDRHYRNISMLKHDSGGFSLAPVFDNGGALLSDEFSYSGDSLETLVKNGESKPFSRNFDEQLDAAENLYGVQIEFPADTKFLEEIEKEVTKYYTIEQFKRVEYVLRHSTRKYSYLAKNHYGIAKPQASGTMKFF